MMYRYFTAFMMVLWVSPICSTTNDCVRTRQTSRNKNRSSVSIHTYLSTEYDKAIRPGCGGKPTEIELNLYIESFSNIEEVKMEFGVFMYFRSHWRDERLQNLTSSKLVLNKEYIGQIWHPDIFCSNARQSNLMLPDTEVHSMVVLSSDGSVTYSRNSHIVASCRMDLRSFPMDVQRCNLTFESYGYNKSDLVLKWKKDPVSIGKRSMAQFYMRKHELHETQASYTTGIFTKLYITFMFERSLGYYLIQIYVPCGFLVMLSWIVFWMSPDDGASRLTVGITTILTIVFLLGYTNSMLPKVSYAKGMDWYLMTSFLFIFLTLVECIVVEKIWRKKTRKENKSKQKKEQKEDLKENFIAGSQQGLQVVFRARKPTNGGKAVECIIEADPSSKHSETSTAEVTKNWENEIPSTLSEIWQNSDEQKTLCCTIEDMCRSVDRCSRILFPLLFTIYNLCYWTLYLV